MSPTTLAFLILSLTLCAAFGARAETPRTHRLFDTGWRFHRGEAAGAEAVEFDDGAWRTVDLPHDWSIEDLPPSDTPDAPSVSLVPGAWRFAPGDDLARKEPGFDDSGWKELSLPVRWSQHGDLKPRAYGWYRRTFAVPASARGKDVVLLLGKVDDADETFVNGVKVGGMGSFPPNYATAWEAIRRYAVPAGLLKGDGTDVVAVRVYNGDGDAGIYEPAHAPRRRGPFDADAEGGTAQGYTVGGIGWYRKTFSLPAALRGKQIRLTFDGVYMNCTVWLNGRQVASHPYGYTSFHVDLTPVARLGGAQNVLAVRVDASGKTSRWYSGAGIYRHVWLTAAAPVHVEEWGVRIATPKVSAARATVRVETSVVNASSAAASAVVSQAVLGPDGSRADSEAVTHAVEAGGVVRFAHELQVAKPLLWSPDSPHLYRLVTTVRVKGRVVDETSTPFGIRTVSVDAERGFLLNGKPMKLRGGCVHHDNGCLGACAYDRAEERRVQLLKACGFNAIRTSHNPPSPAFLDACDRIGMLVMDEAFDCWRIGKNPNDYGRFFDEWWRKDLASMVLRDGHHPSVVLWSIGNEIPGQDTAEGAEIGGRLAAYVRELDPTRPVAQAAFPEERTEKLDALFAHLDVMGYNYMWRKYAPDHERAPKRVMAGTESFPRECFESWMATIDHPWVIGDFVWTAMDYLGEAGIGKSMPQSLPPGYEDPRLWTVSNCGDIDLIGDKRPPSYYRDAVWGLKPMIAAFVPALGPDGKPEVVGEWNWGWIDERPSWTWPGREGSTVTVHVYSSCPNVRLLLNGRDLGVKATTRATRFTATYEVPMEPGELVAIGYDARGNEAARQALRTVGKAAAIRLQPDRSVLMADGQDLSFVVVDIVDARGARQPNADHLVRFSLTGPGRIVGVGNADPRSEESFQRPERRAWRGRCLVVVRAGARAGEIRLKAASEGLKSAEVVIRTGK